MTTEVIVALAHPKGGVGRTTSALMLGLELTLAREDLVVLAEDLDPEQHLTRIWPTDVPRLHLDGADAATRGHGDAATDGAVALAASPCRSIAASAPTIIRLLDTAPGARELGAALERAQHVVVPVRPERLTVQALGIFALQLAQVQRRRGGPPALLGLLITMASARSPEHARWIAELERYAPTLGTTILGRIPMSEPLRRLDSRGHHYRGPAAAILEALAL